MQGEDGIRINPTYVTDAAAAIRSALELSASHKINVAGPEILSLRSIASIIGFHCQKKPRFLIHADQTAPYVAGDIRKMTALLGAPRITMDEGIQRYLEAQGP